MKRILSVLVFVCLTFTSFAQFSDTVELNQYIRDTIKDRRPSQISASQVQKALLGLSHFLGGAAADVSGLHKNATINFNGTGIIFYNSAGDSIGTVIVPHTDIFTDGGLVQRDTLTNALVLAAGRLDTSWISGVWTHNLYMSGAHDSVQYVVDGGIPTPTGSAVSSGTFTSAVTSTLNISSTDAAPVIKWTKIDGNVHLSISAGLTPTATGGTNIRFTLPSTTSLANGSLVGSGSVAENAGTAVAPAYVFVSSSTSVTIRFIATVVASGSYFITIDYPE